MNSAIHAMGLVPADSAMGPLELAIVPGEIVCVLGRDPALRSAYMRVLAGAEYPLAGELEVFGCRLSRLDDRAWLALRRDVGFVPREAPLLSAMDGLGNVTMPAFYHGFGSRSEVEGKARDWLARLGFTGDPRLLPAYLTDMERRVLALARAVMLEPKILLLDDPFTGLHGEAVHAVARVFGDWARQSGATLVYATDDAAFVRRFADRLLFIGSPQPRMFESWTEFHDAHDMEVQRYFSQFRTEAMAFE
jgi:putative ABC transport system ATP-binding protein